MDLTLTSKLLKYSPSDVQAVRYTLSYARNNFEGDSVQDYIQEHCKSNAQKEIAELLEQGNGTSNAATINGKSSAASGKIDKVKEKPSTEGSTSPAMKSIEPKGDAKKVGYKGGLEGTGTNVVQKEETSWLSDVVEELGEEFDELTDEDLENVILEALEDLGSEELISEAIDSFEGLELLTEAPSKHSANPNIAVQAPQKTKERDAGALARAKLGGGEKKQGRMSRLANAAKGLGAKIKSGAAKVGSGVKSAVKTGAKKVIGTAAKAAGHAAGSYDAARIKAKRTELSKPTATGATGSTTTPTGTSSSTSTTTTTTTGGAGEQPKKKSLLRRAAGAIGRGLKKVVGKTSRAVSKGSDKLARKLGEDSTMENKVSRIRQILAMQETMAHDQKTLDADANSWRERLGWDLEEEQTPEQKKKAGVLKQTKELTNKGKHKEASALFKKHFPNFGK
jgi:hypothetical protein